MKRRAFLLGAPLALAACGAESEWAPDEMVQRLAYRHPGPARLTLFTMKNTGSGNGAHTGLMINASQRVIWDPAGSFKHSSIPERNDVIFGIDERVAQYYRSFHSRETFYTVIQELEVAPEVAERALQLVMAYGAASKATCTKSTSTILSQLPGFGHIKVSLFPNNLADQFGRIAGVRTTEYRENDSGDLGVAEQNLDASITAEN